MSSLNIDGEPIQPLPPIVNIPPDVWEQMSSSGFTDCLPNDTRRFANDFIEWICHNAQRPGVNEDAPSFYNEDEDLVLRVRLVDAATSSTRAWQLTFELLDERGGEYYSLNKIEPLIFED